MPIRRFIISLLILFAGAAGRAGAAPAAAPAWTDIAGHAYGSADIAKAHASVFIFVSTQCPICSIYSPRIAELSAAYASHGVRFYLVDPDTEDTAAALSSYVKDRRLPMPAVRDKGLAVTDWLAADTTPEAVMVDSGGTVRYRGRIDDNRDRDKVIRHDLKDALDCVLAGKAVERGRTRAFGCVIFREPAKATATAGAVTYADDVAPILNRSCVDCHRPGQAAPFSLTTYQEAHTWARQIRDYTAQRLMPPWKAQPGWGEFHDARDLAPADIATLAKWANSGAPMGNAADIPPPPHYDADVEWKLGKPDMIIRSDKPYHLSADGADVYREFVVVPTVNQDTYISAIEFHPDKRAVVHHMIVFFDPTGESKKLDGKEKEPGYTVSGAGIGTSQSTWVAGWAAGATPYFLPAGTAYLVRKGESVVLQVHYHKDGQVETDNSSIGVHFADAHSVHQIIRVGAAINAGFDLKPGVDHQEVKADLTIPTDVHVWAVFPHMHMLGKEMKIKAILPDGAEQKLVWINDWDFNWQETYRYMNPLALPAGTKVQLTAYFDNSERNSRQPSHPPKEVRWGEQTTDEMCIGFFQYTIDKENLQVK